jgi:hypothetical protein
MKVSGGAMNEGGLIFFGGEQTARRYADSLADPMSVKSAEEAGVERLPGKVFETVTDRPYKLINRYYKINQKEADALTKALGIPEYKKLPKDMPLEMVATRAHDFTESYKVKNFAGKDRTISAPWPIIFKTLNVDGFFDGFAVALTADNGIRLVGEEGKLQKFSLRDTTDPSIVSATDRVTTAREEKGFAERMMGAISPESYSTLRAKAINRYDQLSKYDKMRAEKMGGWALMADASAESAALMSDLASGVTASVLGVHDRQGGIPVFRNGITTVWNDNGKLKGPTAIFAPLAKYKDPYIYQLYQFWAGSQRGARLMADGKEKLYTPADIAYAQQLLNDHPEFKTIQKEWTEFNDGLVKYLVDTGVLSQEKARLFTQYSDYIPFYRQMDGQDTIGPKIFSSISGVKAPKQLKGGEAPLADFLETIVRNTQSAIQMGMKTTAMQRAVQTASDLGLAVPAHKGKTGVDIVEVLENGQVQKYQVADPLFIDAVKSLNLPELPFIGLLSGPANLLRNMVTKDPGFMLANMMRDSMSAWVTSGAKMTPIVSTIKNFTGAIAGTDPSFEALLNAGIIGGYEFSQGIEKSGKQLEKSIAKKAGVVNGMTPVNSLWDALEKGTTASDAATRMEVYKKTLAETGNEAEALFRALEVMNFNRKGSSAVIRIATAAIPFLNARMQGLDILYRASFGQMATKDAAAIQKAFFVRGMTMAALSCMYWVMTHDDDEYKKQEQETKDNNWLFPSIGLRIPIPFEVGVLFKVIPERIMAYSFGDDTGKDFMQSMKRQLVSTLAINPIPQTALPIVEAVTNYSFFTMRPIVGQGMEGVANQFEVGPGTTELAKAFGKMTGLSPMKIDHLIKGYTGSMGMYMVEMLDGVMAQNGDGVKASKRFEQLPIIKRFALDPEARGKLTSYYELKNAADEATRTVNMLERSQKFEEMGEYMRENIKLLATKDYISDLDKTLKEFREIKGLITASKSMTADQKRDAITGINRAENNLVSNIESLKKAVM